MRVNREKLFKIMEQKNISTEEICIRTGIYKKSIEWIMNNGSVSEEALERIADAVEVNVKDIYLPDITSFNENVIEFTKDSERATVTLSQGRFKSKVKKLAELYPDECEIVAVNKDGSIYAHISTKLINLRVPTRISEHLKKERSENLVRYRQKRVILQGENEQIPF